MKPNERAFIKETKNNNNNNNNKTKQKQDDYFEEDGECK